MKRLELDGVPVFVSEAPGPLSAALVFRVGRRDETFVDGGITHLVEHLAMATIGRTHLDCNGSVDLGWTEFTATGRPDAVASFLTRICIALSDLPLGRLATEVGVLSAEGGGATQPLAAHVMSRRYGAHDLGLAGLADAAVDQITAENVRRWADTYFVRENAAVWLTGPVPEGLRLRLPSGARNPRTGVTRRLPLPYPVLIEHPFEEGVALSFEVDHTALPGLDDEQVRVCLAAAMRILIHQLTDDLRHARGLAYQLDFDLSEPTAGTSHVVVHADPKRRDAARVAQGVLDGVRGFAANGPSGAELDYDLEGMREFLDDPRSVINELGAATAYLLSGTPVLSSRELLARREELTADAARDVVRAGLGSLMLAVPDGVPLPDSGLTSPPEDWQPRVTGRGFGRRFRSDAPRGSRLVVGEDGVTLVLPDGAMTIRFADVIGLGRVVEGFQRLIGFDGRSIPLDAADWRNGDQAVDAVRAKVPVELWFDEPDDGSQGAGF